MATKTFPYAVIYNGKLYPADTEIVVKVEVEEKPANKPTTKKAVRKDDEGTSRKA